MIRVLNIISDTNIGGAGRVILNYLRFADKSKFETLAAIPGKPAEGAFGAGGRQGGGSGRHGRPLLP